MGFFERHGNPILSRLWWTVWALAWGLVALLAPRAPPGAVVSLACAWMLVNVVLWWLSWMDVWAEPFAEAK